MDILNDNKGVEMKILIPLIIAIIVFLVVLLFTTNLYSAPDKEACRFSIRQRAMFVLGELPKAAGSLQCKTEHLKIDKSYKTEEQILNKIATAMAECWNMVGKGELNFMPKGWGSEEYCLVCTRIEFDDKTKERFPVVQGLIDYMKNNKMPTSDISYYDYIWGKNAELKKEVELTVDTSKEYAVLFALYKESVFTPNLFKFVGVGAGLIASFIFPPAGVAGAIIYSAGGYVGTSMLSFFSTSAGKAGLHLIPFEGEEIEKYCTRFENAP